LAIGSAVAGRTPICFAAPALAHVPTMAEAGYLESEAA
jgi:hypothetical protein